MFVIHYTSINESILNNGDGTFAPKADNGDFSLCDTSGRHFFASYAFSQKGLLADRVTVKATIGLLLTFAILDMVCIYISIYDVGLGHGISKSPRKSPKRGDTPAPLGLEAFGRNNGGVFIDDSTSFNDTSRLVFLIVPLIYSIICKAKEDGSVPCMEGVLEAIFTSGFAIS